MRLCLLPLAAVMALGDSLTAGVSHSGCSGRSAAWRQDFYEQVIEVEPDLDLVGSDWGGRFADPDHEGHRGHRCDQLEASLDGWLLLASPDVVLLMCGTNEVSQGYSTEETLAHLDAVLDTIFAWGSPRVLVGSLPPIADERGPAVDALNAALPGHLATWNFEHAPGASVEHVGCFDGLLGPDDYQPDDPVHPNASGDAKMAACWAGAYLGGP